MGVTVGPGATIAGRYRLESPIGEGGFGAVFRATDLRTGTLVAVKVLLEGAFESGARFRREAELAMRLSHPNTVRTYDAGEDAETGSYIVLELLHGGSLEQVLRAQGPFGQRAAAEIAMAVLGSLGEAHAFGIVHRDIKPANVFLMRAPEVGVKVLDFGIAKSTNEGTHAGLTREGQTIGTPAYMAPEQIKGADLGPETDLYALALVLAEAISGQRVYASDNGLAVLVDKLHGVDPQIPPVLRGSPLEQVVRRATRFNREDRYRSAEEMSGALASALAQMSTSSSYGGDRPSANQLSSRGGPHAGAEWGTESMPGPAPSSPTAAATAETHGMDVPSPRAAMHSSPTTLDAISIAPTTSVPAMSGRPSAESGLPFSAPAASQQAMNDSIASLPAASMPIASGPYPTHPSLSSSATVSAPMPSGPTLALESDPPPFPSPFARPAPARPLAPKKSSGWVLGCLIVGLLTVVAVAGVAALIGFFVWRNNTPDSTTRTSGPRTAKPSTRQRPSESPAPPQSAEPPQPAAPGP